MTPHYNGSSSFGYYNVDPTGYYRKQQEKRTALVFEKAKIRMVSDNNRRGEDDGGDEGEEPSSTSPSGTVAPMGKVECEFFLTILIYILLSFFTFYSHKHFSHRILFALLQPPFQSPYLRWEVHLR